MADKEKELSPEELGEKIDKILEKSRIIDSNGWKIQYNLEILSPFEKPEKFYGFVLREVRGEFKNVLRVDQSLNASPTSAFFADVSQRRAIAKENVDKSMGIVAGIVQTITKLLYSLREFDSVLDIIKKLDSSDKLEVFAAEQNLRRIFLDEVDSKKGRGGMYQMQVAQGMEYVNLVDSFLTIETLKDIDDLRSNDRIKRILKGRFQEYELWKVAFKKDMVSRKEIQKQFLKSQVESLKIQLDWIKPYYTLLKQLEIKSGTTDPDLLAGFDTSLITTKIRCIDGGQKNDSLVTAFLDVDFSFKTGPYPIQTDSGGRAYHHRFGTKITYTPYIMKNEDYEDFVKKETMKEIDFFKDIVGSQLKAMQEDLDKYLGGQDYIGRDDSDDDKAKPLNQFEFLTLPFKGLLNLFGISFEKKGKPKAKFSLFKYENDLDKFREKLKKATKDLYTLFKDENGLPTESATLSLN
ncbi:MAG: hypothetical protein WC393_03725 [Candidatus Nanoarchaeia archaeon]|jgi:hypothetical protein